MNTDKFIMPALDEPIGVTQINKAEQAYQSKNVTRRPPKLSSGKRYGRFVRDEYLEDFQKVNGAIIFFAVEDYRKARKKLRKKPTNKKALKEYSELRDYFLTTDFIDLGFDIHGEWLLQELDKEVFGDESKSKSNL